MGLRPAVLAVALLPAPGADAAGAKEVAEAGPFRIETVEKSIGAGGFPNTSGNPFRRTQVTVLRLKHRGKPVSVRDGGHSNDEFWEARFLEGSPRVERGDTLLLVNRQVLLDVPRLAARPMSAYTTENVNRAQRYNASGQPARAMSPAPLPSGSAATSNGAPSPAARGSCSARTRSPRRGSAVSCALAGEWSNIASRPRPTPCSRPCTNS